MADDRDPVPDPWRVDIDPHPLRGRWVGVSGASKGIGQGVAAHLLAAGANLVLIARNPDDLNAAADAARAHATLGQQVIACAADVSSRDSIDELFGFMEEKIPALHHWVANAGTGFVKPLIDMSRSDWDAIVDLNLTGTIYGVQRAAQLMIERQPDATAAGDRSVVLVSSIRALGARAGRLVYSATKAAVNQAARCAALEFAPHGIRVNVLSPGITETPLSSKNPEAFNAAVANVPLGRAAQPSDLGAACAFLCSPAARFSTGINLVVDGGESLH